MTATAFDPAAAPADALASDSDISRRLVERERELAQRVMEVEIELNERRWAEAELRRQADELTRVNQELEQFAYAVSHDLQAPLRGISGFSRLLRRQLTEAHDPDAIEYLGFIEDGAKRLHHLITDLLEYSRAGRRALERRAVDLAQVSREAVETLRPALLASRGEIVVEGRLPHVLGDPVPLAQLFRNLYDNAVKYATPGRPPRVVVSADPEPDADGDGNDEALGPPMATVRIADNGIGIAPPHLERVFVIFQRLHAEDDYPGTGVGLSVCRKIAERHGGRLHAESPGEGHGTTFVLTLPLAPAARR